ncbi:MAG: proton-translocating NADH-quinone oxidoreductase, chain [Bacteroidetes bacterium]|jgi:NADH-quinone oxidoreductase subunit L|nr:proton-translocating NADH-quinone oxidoreductase, chain [Bacteroidota bacterium]
MIKLIGLVPLFPLIGFIINGFFGKKMGKGLSGTIASLSIAASFVVSLLIFMDLQKMPEKSVVVNLFSWINSDTLKIPFSFLVDPLSSIFLLIITGIGFLIHIYSIGYMHHDEGFARFFTYLNLFIFFMLLLVLGNNYLIMFVGWEGVGLCSYLLIGFWFKNTEYNNAAKKAFVMNRIGDLGFLLGIILIFFTYGTITYGDVFEKAHTGSDTIMTAIALLLFVGAMGKSAQIPLYTWLPDAMAGPTPVSALIHAATMVTAGIYMIVRSNIFYSSSEVASEVVAIVGALTALMAAVIGCAQTDIKKVLAYSTVSQLGLMFLALGVGAYSTAVFHVTTHAFFKALLFLGAGSVIHAMSNEQDMRKMGGLRKALPITWLTMGIATLAISGFPLLSGFFSKDEILAHVWEENKILWIVATLTSLLTAFYMFRMFILTFHTNFRGTAEQKHHLHESPKSMTIPLIVLAILSLAGGLLGLPEAFHGNNWISGYLSPIIAHRSPSTLSHETEYMLMGIATLVFICGAYTAYNVYQKSKVLPAASEKDMRPSERFIYHKFKVDEFYNAVITRPLNGISVAFHKFVESDLIDGLVNGVGTMVKWLSGVIRQLQTGNIGFYIFSMVLGVVAIIFWSVLK